MVQSLHDSFFLMALYPSVQEDADAIQKQCSLKEAEDESRSLNCTLLLCHSC